MASSAHASGHLPTGRGPPESPLWLAQQGCRTGRAAPLPQESRTVTVVPAASASPCPALWAPTASWGSVAREHSGCPPATQDPDPHAGDSSLL